MENILARHVFLALQLQFTLRTGSGTCLPCIFIDFIISIHAPVKERLYFQNKLMKIYYNSRSHTKRSTLHKKFHFSISIHASA